jgi:hypothetical protein
MNVELERLNNGERIAAGSALALFVCMFFRWFNFGFDTASAWSALHYISPILTVVIVYTVGVVAMKALDKDLGDLPRSSAIVALGGFATVLILFRLIDPVSSPGSEGFGTNGSAEAGLFLGLIAAVGIGVGGYLASGGTAFDQLRAMLPTQPPSPPPPAPPVSTPPAPTPQPDAAPADPPPHASPTPVAEAGFCEDCGVALAADDRFCSGCGKERTPSPD